MTHVIFGSKNIYRVPFSLPETESKQNNVEIDLVDKLHVYRTFSFIAIEM